MIPPATAAELVKALAAWRHHLLKYGQSIPAGWDDLQRLARACTTTTDDGPPWLTLDQAADRAHVSVRTLHRWRAAGLPSTTTGARVLVHRDDLDTWLRRQSDDLPDMVGHSDAAGS